MKNIFAIYKPKGPTSHDVIDQLRKITGIKKIGHAGTLDPLASGVLVVGIGREATRELSKYAKLEKEYLATIKLGETSETDDSEGVKSCSMKHVVCSMGKKIIIKHKTCNIEHIKKVLKQFIGKIKQMPPVYSAIKIKGQPAHRRVRRGERVELGPRDVEIKSIKILNYKYPYLKIKVICSSGTYIRSLARDIGQALKTGAYLYDLERIQVGEFSKKDSFNLNNFAKFWKTKI